MAHSSTDLLKIPELVNDSVRIQNLCLFRKNGSHSVHYHTDDLQLFIL